MEGWIIPPPREPTKTTKAFKKERAEKVDWLLKHGLLYRKRIKQALLSVPREDFIPRKYRDYAYMEVPLPLPGKDATISCPHSYPLFYEPLGLDKGHKLLEIGAGSGYGAAVAREIVGNEGLVAAIEIDPLTFAFAKKNLEKAHYNDIILVQGDGGLGFAKLAPYDRISITAACFEIPPPLLDQLKIGGKLIAPLIRDDLQELVLVEKRTKTYQIRVICEVLYVHLKGEYGS